MANRTDKCTITVEIFEHSLQYMIPVQWSVNKVKCLIAQQVPRLSFDEFELVHYDKLLNGSDRLADIVSEQNDNTVALRLQKMESKIKLKEYYGEVMSQILSVTDCEHHPLLCGQYQKSVSLINQHQENENQNDNQQQIEDILAEGGNPWYIIIFRFISFMMLISTLRLHCSAFQAFVICLFIAVYYFIELYRVRNARALRTINGQNNPQPRQNRKQTKNEEEQQEQRGEARDRAAINIKGEVVLKVFKLLQILIIFLLSLFPNWSIRFYLYQFADSIKRVKTIINNYRPHTYPLENDTTNPQADISQQ